jgi:hypothetical protein
MRGPEAEKMERDIVEAEVSARLEQRVQQVLQERLAQYVAGDLFAAELASAKVSALHDMKVRVRGGGAAERTDTEQDAREETGGASGSKGGLSGPSWSLPVGAAAAEEGTGWAGEAGGAGGGSAGRRTVVESHGVKTEEENAEARRQRIREAQEKERLEQERYVNVWWLSLSRTGPPTTLAPAWPRLGERVQEQEYVDTDAAPAGMCGSFEQWYNGTMVQCSDCPRLPYCAKKRCSRKRVA